MLVLVLRLFALYELMWGHYDFTPRLVLALSVFALGFAVLREAARGRCTQFGEYVGIDEGGPSRAAVFLFAGFESCFYVLIYLSFSFFGAVLLILWMLPLGMIWLEGSLSYFRTRLQFTEAGVRTSRVSEEHLFDWGVLSVAHDATHVTLVAGDQRARVRLGAAQTARFLQALAARAVEPLVTPVSSEDAAE